MGGREDLPNAIAFQSMLMNGARFVGPMIGGVVMVVLGVVLEITLGDAIYRAVKSLF